jgi:EpsI family protein
MQTPALRNALLSAALVLIAILAYWPTSAALWGWWTNDNHGGAHGLAVAPLAAWLLYRKRYALATVAPRPSRLALGLLLLGSIAWLVFWRAGIQELHLLLWPILVGLAICAALGFGALPHIAFPLGFLYFAVPAWGIFIQPLQRLTVIAIGVLAPLVGVHEHIQGDLVIMPGVGIIEIGAACSGANFFCVGLAIAALLGELEDASLPRRAWLLAAMGAVAVVSNWLRVLIIVEAGYSTNMRHVLVSRGHYTFGWVLFATVMLLFVWLLARPAAARGTPELPAGTRLVTAPAFAFSVAGLVAMPLAVYTVVSELEPRAAPVSFAAPAGRGGWVGPLDGGRDWKPDFVGPHSQWYVAYQGPAGHNVDMVAVGYSTQAQGQELVNEENSLLGDSATTAADTITLGAQSFIETVATDTRGERTLVWSVYDIGGQRFVTPFLSQLWYGLRSLGGAPYSVLFAFRTTCESSSCEAARATLRSFVQTMGSDFFGSVSRSPQSTHSAGHA